VNEAPVTLDLPPAPEFGAPIDLEPAPEVLDFLALRRSASAVTLGEPGPTDEELSTLLRLASRVPDHGKLSPWRFVVLRGADKAAFAARLEALAHGRGDSVAAAKLAKLKIPPLAVAVVSSPREAPIPEWEQILSAGAAATTLLYAAQALGYGANWITDWYAYDAEAREILGLAPHERVAAFIMLGAAKEPPRERERPEPANLVTRWRPA
jgi:nitroreductase